MGKKFKVYVAGSSMEPDRVEAIVELLEREPDVEVIGKWTPSTRRHGSQGAELAREARWREAESIRETLMRADGFLFLTPRSPATTKGGFWECGFAEGVASMSVDRVTPLLVLACDGGVLPEFILDVPSWWTHVVGDVDAAQRLVARMREELAP